MKDHQAIYHALFIRYSQRLRQGNLTAQEEDDYLVDLDVAWSKLTHEQRRELPEGLHPHDHRQRS